MSEKQVKESQSHVAAPFFAQAGVERDIDTLFVKQIPTNKIYIHIGNI